MSAPNERSPNSPESVVPLSMKLMLLGAGILVMIMLVFTVRAIINIFCSTSSPSAAMQTNTETVAVHPKPPAGTPPLSAPVNSKTEASPSSQPSPFAVQIEVAEQRQKARVETIEALKREAQEQAGTSGVPKEVLQKLEQSDPTIY